MPDTPTVILVRDMQSPTMSWPVIAPPHMLVWEASDRVDDAIKAIDPKADYPYGELETALTPLGFMFPSYGTATQKIR